MMKFRIFDQETKTMKQVSTMEFNQNGELDYVCVDFEDVGSDPKSTPPMAFTGFYDKNGDEIYEGDIVRYTVYNKGLCGDYLIRRVRSGAFRMDNFVQGRELFLATQEALEIIGNEYTHPEKVF